MNDHYNTLDDSTGNQLLQISCNMNKCKYENMNNFFSGKIQYDEVYLYISLNSIFLDWSNISNDKFENFSDEEINARLFEVVTHYKRYFEERNIAKTVKVFLYYSFDWQKKFKTMQFRKNEDFFRIPEINTAISRLSTIVEYIPGMYLIDTKTFNPGILPYFVESERRDRLVEKGVAHYKHLSFIVSAQDIDYCALGVTMPGIENVFNSCAFRRRHNTPVTKKTVLETTLFKNRKRAYECSSYYLWFYPKLLTVNAGRFKIVNSSDYLAKDIKKDITRHLCETTMLDSEMSIWMSEISDKIRSNSRLNELNRMVDIPRAYNENLLELRQYKNLWMSDKIDYSIETLNEEYFKHYKVDWASLF